MHRSPAADKGPIGFAVEGLRPAPYATCNCGIRDDVWALTFTCFIGNLD